MNVFRKCKVPQCERQAVVASGYCDKHSKPFKGTFKHGRYSKYLNTAMAKVFDEMDSQEEVSVEQELALLRTLLIEKLEMLRENDDYLTVSEMKGVAESVTRTIREMDGKEFELNKKRILEKLAQISDAGKTVEKKEQIKGEIRTLTAEITAIARAESAIRYAKTTSITNKEMQAVLIGLLGVLAKHIDDQYKLDAIRFDFARLFNRPVSSGISTTNDGFESLPERSSDTYQRPPIDQVSP